MPLTFSSLSFQLFGYQEIENREDLVFLNFVQHNLETLKQLKLDPNTHFQVHSKRHHFRLKIFCPVGKFLTLLCLFPFS